MSAVLCNTGPGDPDRVLFAGRPLSETATVNRAALAHRSPLRALCWIGFDLRVAG